MIIEIAIGMGTGLVSGLVLGYAVYYFTNKREEKRRVFQFWENFLYKASIFCSF